MHSENKGTLRGFADWRWDQVALHPYKEDDAALHLVHRHELVFHGVGVHHHAAKFQHLDLAS